MRTLDDIVADMARLVHEAHELGRADGAAPFGRLRAKLKANLAAILDSESELTNERLNPQNERILSLSDSRDHGSDVGVERAPMGTVKPAIVRLINETPAGLTQDEIIERTGFKSNSVRGTLYSIVNEGLVQRKSGRFFPSGQNIEGPGIETSGPS